MPRVTREPCTDFEKFSVGIIEDYATFTIPTDPEEGNCVLKLVADAEVWRSILGLLSTAVETEEGGYYVNLRVQRGEPKL